MDSGKAILIGGIIIIAIGATSAAVHKKPETPVFAGGIGALVLASLLDALGPGPGKVAAGLVGLAAVTVVFSEGPALFQAISNAQNKKSTNKG